MRALLNKGDHIICNYGDATVIADDGQYVVCKLDDGRIVTTPTNSVAYIPSPQEIEKQCDDIQHTWTPRIEWIRTSPSDRKWPVEIPGGETNGMPLTTNDFRLHFNEDEDENGQ